MCFYFARISDLSKVEVVDIAIRFHFCSLNDD